MAFASSSKVFLVLDHEKCLWTDEAREALEDEGITLLEDFPKCSQDLNPIEVCWRELRARLNATMPTEMETRPQFVQRVHNAVRWLNSHRQDYFKHLCTCQKKWARDVAFAQPPGARTQQ